MHPRAPIPVSNINPKPIQHNITMPDNPTPYGEGFLVAPGTGKGKTKPKPKKTPAAKKPAKKVVKKAAKKSAKKK